jgi:hypothetical protein
MSFSTDLNAVKPHWWLNQNLLVLEILFIFPCRLGCQYSSHHSELGRGCQAILQSPWLPTQTPFSVFTIRDSVWLISMDVKLPDNFKLHWQGAYVIGSVNNAEIFQHFDDVKFNLSYIRHTSGRPSCESTFLLPHLNVVSLNNCFYVAL